MKFPRRMGRWFGRCVLVLFLLGHALAHVSGQVASANPGLPTSSKTDHNVTIPLAFAQQSLPDAMIGVPYQSSAQAIGGSGLYDLSVTGDLPPGLSMETGGSTVAVRGIPTTTGTYEFQVTIRDVDGTSFKRDFSIHVFPRVPGAKALQQLAPMVSEDITVTEVASVFFPVVVIDKEAITVNDAVTGLDAAEAVDNENITVSDTVTVALLRVPRIYWTAPAPIVYGTPLSATQLDATGSVDGKLTYNPPAGTVLPAGQQTLSVTLTPNDTTDYGPATDTVTLTVNQASQSITFTPPTSPVNYPVSPITLSATGGMSGKPVTFSIVSGPGSLSGTNSSLLTVTGAGTIVIAANQAGNTDYSPAPQVTQSIVVDQLAALTTPTPGSLLTSATVLFKWTAGAGVTQYDLHLSAVSAGGYDLYSSGHITGTSTSVHGLPTNGQMIYARLYSVINGVTFYNDYIYATGSLAQLTSPAPTAPLTSATQLFKWTAGTGVTQYDLHLSAVAPGGYDLYSSGHITGTSTPVYGLPTSGQKIYARLYSVISGVTFYNDYIYATGSLAQLTSPAPTAPLTAATQLFKWTAGTGVTQYDLHLSAVAPGGYDLYSSGHITGTSTPVHGLPTNGENIYARLYSVIDGVTFYNDYTYATGSLAQLTSPAPGSTLTATTQSFKWTAGTGVTQYDLHLSAVAPGGYDLYSSGHITGTSTTVSGLPTNGETIYARLYSVINGVMLYNDYTYTAK